MGFWKRLFGAEERENKELLVEDTSGTLEVGAELLRVLLGEDDFTAEKALEIPAFSAAVDFIADHVAMLPIKLYKDNPAEKKADELTGDKRLFYLNDEANGIMTAYDAKRAFVRDMIVSGAGFMYINEDYYGNVTSLHYVRKSDVSITSNSDPIFRDFNIYVGGRGYLPWNFIILTRNSKDGVTGIGAFEEHKTLLSSMYSLMRFEKLLAKAGGARKGFLESEINLTDKKMAELRQAWKELYSNEENNALVLNKGVKYVPGAVSSVEMQLNENKKTNSEQITQIFGLSPEVISGKCTTQEYMSAIRTAVLPVVERFQAALNRSMLREDEKPQKYFVLDTSELLKGDMLTRYQAYEIGLRNNFLQLDDVRYAEDMAPLGFDYMKLDLSAVLYDLKTKTIYTPNMNALQTLGAQSAAQEELRALVEYLEYRKKTNWIKGAHGYFAGSYPEGGGGNSGLTNGGNGGIINSGSDKVTISSIDSPIEQKHTGKGNPNAIVHFDVELNNRQQELLNALPEYDSRHTVPKNAVNMTDLSALTAKTGDEFAMFTKGGERLVIRGAYNKVNITIEEAKSLAAQGYRWSGHTHPGNNMFCLTASDGDYDILRAFEQETSVIYNSKGQYKTFNDLDGGDDHV